MDLAKQSQTVCNELADVTRETINVAILDGARIVNLVEAIGPAEIALRSWVGQTCPVHATSSGKALLSGLSPGRVRELLGKRLETYTPDTIVEWPALHAELEQARRRGWASAREELEVGLNAIAAPVRDGNGQIIAALSVSGPAYRLKPERFDEVAELTMAAAHRISRRLGYLG